ncbi:MAG: chaperone modulator CbpM [Xanthomonadales bacterium]|nr:chaperone modulator CbpM [Xanthomonadales bacterium]
MSSERNGEKILVGEVLEENYLVSLADLCRSCTVESQTITTLVAEGILSPMGEDVEHWRFTVSSLRRVKTVIHLQRDLGVNVAGAALALDLLDRIAELERI